MKKSINPGRYAQAVFLLGKEQDRLAEWLQDLDTLTEIMSDETIRSILQNPKISVDEKEKMIKPASGFVSLQAMNLARLLLSHNHVHVMADIREEYRRLYYDYLGLEKARVITAVPLDEKGAATLADDISLMTGKKIELEAEVDPSIIGGFIARVGGQLLDGSVISSLDRLKRQLTSGEKRR